MTHKVGISFREVMSGGFVLGATDPAEGEKQGRAQGSEMTMHGAIDIDDIDRVHRRGRPSGRPDRHARLHAVRRRPGGDHGGIFNLFSPTSDPKLKLMVYEMGFQHGGKSYYLAGQKNVKEDPIFDLWKATTTLYSQLYEGTDKSGPVVGAGILSLGVKQLIQLISTVKTPGSDLVHRVVGGDREVRPLLPRRALGHLREARQTVSLKTFRDPKALHLAVGGRGGAAPQAGGGGRTAAGGIAAAPIAAAAGLDHPVVAAATAAASAALSGIGTTPAPPAPPESRPRRRRSAARTTSAPTSPSSSPRPRSRTIPRTRSSSSRIRSASAPAIRSGPRRWRTTSASSTSTGGRSPTGRRSRRTIRRR